MNYYTKCNGNEGGPFSREQIKMLFANGFLKDSDYIKTDTVGWTTVRTIKGNRNALDHQNKGRALDTANLAATLGLGGLSIYQASQLAEQSELIAQQGQSIADLSAQVGEHTPLGDLLGDVGDVLDSLL